MRVLYFLRDNGGCGYYRADLPWTICKNKKEEALVDKIERGDPCDKIEGCINRADIAMVPRVKEPEMVAILKNLQAEGVKVVVDWDDNIFCVSPLSPHYEDYGTEEYFHVLPTGEKIPVWVDGKNINLKANRSCQEAAKTALRLADCVTVTTPILAEVYRQFNPNVVVLPNCIDMSLWRRLPLKREKKEVRMGWFGGHSHYEDWLVMSSILPGLMARYSELKLVILGAHFPGTLKGIPKDQIEIHNWSHTMAYPLKAAILDLDFAIIPLQDTEFNRCKSAIKWIEMAGLKVPAVTSYVSPYAEMMDMVPNNGIFVSENDISAWTLGIVKMIENLEERKAMGEAAYQTVKKHFDINTQYRRWIDTYKEVMACHSRKTHQLTIS